MSFHLMMLLMEILFSLFLFVKLRLAFGPGWWQLPVLVWLVAMMGCLFLRRSGTLPPSVEETLVYLGFLWLGFMLFFLGTALALDLVGALFGRAWWGVVGFKKGVPAMLILAVMLSGFAYWQAHHPRLVTVEIFSDKLPVGVDVLRVVQLSDVHLSRSFRHNDLERITRLAAAARPDILAVTGDVVDTDMRGREADAALIAGIKPRYGAFVIFGNHEQYAGPQNSAKFFQRAGLRLLRGEAETAGGLVVAGVDDDHFYEGGSGQAAAKLLSSVQDQKRFVLFLKHRPNLIPGTAGLFDLQLSGHTHGGQIWPGHLLIQRVNGFLSGLYNTPGGRLYVSRGAGFWGLPMRFLAPPEVTLIEIKRGLVPQV